MNYKDKKILITGGTGFLGRALTKRFLDSGVEYIRILSRDEHKQEAMEKEFGADWRLRFILGDVRDLETLKHAFQGVDIVMHTAALKVIPSLEYAPMESVKTNILGTWNVIEAALYNDVEKTVGISSDKAILPLNVYGACKAVGEKLLVRANVLGKTRSRFSVVRFGNIFGSTGSVVPLFIEQARASPIGPLCVTDPKMTRYLVGMVDALDTVEYALTKMDGGEIFLKESQAARVADIAQAVKEVVNQDSEVKITGIRPGEKVHELLLSEHESGRTVTSGIPPYYIVLPSPVIRKDYKWEYPSLTQERFELSSENAKMLGIDELGRWIQSYMSSQK